MSASARSNCAQSRIQDQVLILIYGIRAYEPLRGGSKEGAPTLFQVLQLGEVNE